MSKLSWFLMWATQYTPNYAPCSEILLSSSSCILQYLMTNLSQAAQNPPHLNAEISCPGKPLSPRRTGTARYLTAVKLKSSPRQCFTHVILLTKMFPESHFSLKLTLKQAPNLPQRRYKNQRSEKKKKRILSLAFIIDLWDP